MKIFLTFLLVACLGVCPDVRGQEEGSPGNRFYVLVSTFPVYQIARNVARGSQGVELDLMLPARQGCPHDYALTPRDMRRLAEADLLIINGLGLEEFMGAPVTRANPGLEILDSCSGIDDLILYEKDDDHKHGEHGEHAADDHAHTHQLGEYNPHLFASPLMAARIAENIGAGLARLDKENAGLYSGNASRYAARLRQLGEEMARAGQGLANNRIVQPHGVFDYLARDMGLEVVVVMQSHGQEPSAAEMMEMVREIRSRQVGAIFVEPQYTDKVGQTLARETGVVLAVLDPVATGDEDAPLDYYEQVMRENLRVIVDVLNRREQG